MVIFYVCFHFLLVLGAEGVGNALCNRVCECKDVILGGIHRRLASEHGFIFVKKKMDNTWKKIR